MENTLINFMGAKHFMRSVSVQKERLEEQR